MTDPLDRVLQLVAEGKLSADDAAPILDALDRKANQPGPATEPGRGNGDPRTARYARIEVSENGRRVVNLRIPISLGRFALARVPGLSKEQIADVEDAVTSGAHGSILDVQDADGDGVRIVLE